MVDNHYKEGLIALPQLKVLSLKNAEVHSGLKQHIGNPVRRGCGIFIKSPHVSIQGKI